MKVLIDLTSLADNFSGIERYALSISQEIVKHDRRNRYILLFKNNIHPQFEKFKNEDNIDIEIIYGKNKLWFNQIKLTKYLYKCKADKYLFLAFPSPILFRKLGIINTIHDLTAWDFPETMTTKSKIYFRESIKNAINSSEKIFTVSNYSKNRIEEKFNIGNIHVVYNGVSDVFKKKYEHSHNQLVVDKYNLPMEYIMCLCTLEPRKNISLLINSYLELRKEGKIDCKLVLVGRKGWKIDNLIKNINDKYKQDIIITGFVDDKDIPYIYSNAKLFVFPSLYEGFGIPVLEAMAVGVPIISSNSTSLPEVMDNTGILFENNNIHDLKCKIVQFFNMEKKEINININKARKRATYFDWGIEAKKIIKILSGNGEENGTFS